MMSTWIAVATAAGTKPGQRGGVKAVRGVVCGLLACLAVDSWAADWKPLTGTYAITAKHYLDPAEGEARDSHIRFQLSGDAAKDLYLAMKAAERPDECTSTTVKTIGAMQCRHDPRDQTFSCEFSIDIAGQTIDYGVAC